MSNRRPDRALSAKKASQFLARNGFKCGLPESLDAMGSAFSWPVRSVTRLNTNHQPRSTSACVRCLARRVLIKVRVRRTVGRRSGTSKHERRLPELSVDMSSTTQDSKVYPRQPGPVFEYTHGSLLRGCSTGTFLLESLLESTWRLKPLEGSERHRMARNYVNNLWWLLLIAPQGKVYPIVVEKGSLEVRLEHEIFPLSCH